MKAKIRKTGEIVEIISYSGNTDRNNILDKVSYIDSNGIEHPREELNFYWDFEVIPNEKENPFSMTDWNQVRIQASIGAMQAILGSKFNYDNYKDVAAHAAVEYADALIKELKK